MKPDRILLAEVRGGEAYDFLNVILSGHGGSITIIHVGNCAEAINRLIMLCMANAQAQKMGIEAIKLACESTINLVLHINSKKQLDDLKVNY